MLGSSSALLCHKVKYHQKKKPPSEISPNNVMLSRIENNLKKEAKYHHNKKIQQEEEEEKLNKTRLKCNFLSNINLHPLPILDVFSWKCEDQENISHTIYRTAPETSFLIMNHSKVGTIFIFWLIITLFNFFLVEFYNISWFWCFYLVSFVIDIINHWHLQN